MTSTKRYVVLAEGHSGDPQAAKTMCGLVRYAPAPTVAIIDSDAAGGTYEDVPIVASIDDAMRHGPTTLAVGVAPAGGQLPESWRQTLLRALEYGLDLEAGLHTRLSDDPELRTAAKAHGVALVDLRRPPEDLGVPTGENRTHGATVVHTVGSDCAIGKKTMALELDLEARRRGLESVFVPTGQTGVAIAGWGIAVDAVIADFVAGAGERLVVEGARRGDLLWVEGQGSLVHPSYAAVTLGLFHGCLPHFLVLCHLAGSTHVEGHPDHPLPSLARLVELYEQMALPVRPARVVAIALNTAQLTEDEARRAVAAAQLETGLPAGDPVRFGAEVLLDAVLEARRAAA